MRWSYYDYTLCLKSYTWIKSHTVEQKTEHVLLAHRDYCRNAHLLIWNLCAFLIQASSNATVHIWHKIDFPHFTVFSLHLLTLCFPEFSIHSRNLHYLCSSSLLSWCRDRGGEGNSISLRRTPGDSQQVASMPMPCPGSLSRLRPRRVRRPPPCCCPVALMKPCFLLVWSLMALPLPLPLPCPRG